MGLTTVGREWVIDKVQSLAPLSNATMTAVAWGTGTNAEAIGDTALQTEASEARTAGALTQPTTTTDRCTGTITCAGAGKTITECGRFNSTTPAGSTLQQRHVFTGIPLVVGDSIAFTLDMTD